MENILILNATPRNRINREVIIQRADYDCVVQSESNCYKIQDILSAKLNGHYLEYVNLKGIQGCTACYGCVKTGKCIKNDVMKDIYSKLEWCSKLFIITPLYYATIPSQLLAFFNRLYPYWISSYNLDPKTGFPNNYPKIEVTTFGTCADPWQDWKLFDDTLKHIYNEIGWKNNGIFHMQTVTDDFELDIR
jgi:hypothetical protein